MKLKDHYITFFFLRGQSKRSHKVNGLNYALISYSRYNQIKMDHIDAPKRAFMSNHSNYYYNVMPFGLKNAISTYHRLMDAVFSKKKGHDLEVYIDDMIVNMS